MPRDTITCDFDIHDSGSIWLLEPITDAAHSFAIDTFQDATWYAGQVAMEPRYVLPIASQLIHDEGFRVALDGRELAEVRPA